MVMIALRMLRSNYFCEQVTILGHSTAEQKLLHLDVAKGEKPRYIYIYIIYQYEICRSTMK